MTTIMNRYNLQDFSDITFNGFDIQLPDETMSIITELALQVGSPTYIRTPTFSKVENSLRPIRSSSSINSDTSIQASTSSMNSLKKKRKNMKYNECVNDESWESIRTFQATIIEQKTGLEGQIDMIRSYLNKMSEKNYEAQSANISEVLNQLINSHEDMLKVGNAIFEIASNNRFYSKLYADLYTDLIQKFDIMQVVFENSLNVFLEIFNHIEHANSEEDYNEFCRVNKDNERRKSLSSFFVNLATNGVITRERLIELTCNLMTQVVDFITEDNKKSEVDEMVENIVILYNKTWFVGETRIKDELFIDVVKRLAHSKSKTYPSLSNKSIFKFMDMIEM